MHAQQLPPHAHGPPIPMMPHAAAAAMAAGLQPPMPPSTAAGLLALTSSLAGGPGASHLSSVAAAAVSASAAAAALKDHRDRDEKRSSSGKTLSLSFILCSLTAKKYILFLPTSSAMPSYLFIQLIQYFVILIHL